MIFGTLLYNLAYRSKDDLLSILQIPHIRAINLILDYSHLADDDIWEPLKKSGHLLKTVDLDFSVTLKDQQSLNEFFAWNKVRKEVPSLGDLKFEKLESLKLLGSFCEYSEHVYIELLKRSGPRLRTLVIDELFGFNLNFPKLETLISKERISSKKSKKDIIEILSIPGSDLKTLQFDGNYTEDVQVGINLKFPKLETLKITRSHDLTGEGFIELLRMAGNDLKTLHLDFSGITGEGLEALNLQYPKVTSLVLAHCKKLTDRGLCNLLDIFGQQLEHLSLKGSNILGGPLADRIENNPLEKLKMLNLEDCRKLIRSNIQRLSNKMTECEIIVDDEGDDDDDDDDEFGFGSDYDDDVETDTSDSEDDDEIGFDNDDWD